MRRPFEKAAGALALAAALAGCSASPATTNGPQAEPGGVVTMTLADVAANQRACIVALRAHLASLKVTRIDAFLAYTLNGLEVCDASYGLAHLPTRDVTQWLQGADGRRRPAVNVPEQPPAITQLPRDPEARLLYQKFCIRWMDRFLPANIAKNGEDPDTAAADVFNGIEECDAVAGFATISRDDLAKLVKTKNLN